MPNTIVALAGALCHDSRLFSTKGHVTEPTSDIIKPKGATFSVQSFGVTDTGRVRAANEDQFLIAELTKAMRIFQTSLPEPKRQFGEERAHLFLVADGMGGHNAGEKASALAVMAIEQFTLNTFKWFFDSRGPDAQRVLAQFQAALKQADAQIAEEAADNPKLRGMGTTVTMAYQLDSQLCVVHVGDSRAYIFRDDTLHRVTKDHTVVGEMVRAGTLSEEEAAGHKLRHIVTNVVGGPEQGIFVEAHAVTLQAGDYLLLCSDGLTEMVNDDAIAAVMRAEHEPEAACQRLMNAANEAGGRDNVTIVIVRFDPAAPASS